MMKKLTGGLDDYSLRACGYDKEKILKAVSECDVMSCLFGINVM